MTRSETTASILAITNKAGSVNHFDKLDNRTDSYLEKLLMVVKKLKKQNVI